MKGQVEGNFDSRLRHLMREQRIGTAKLSRATGIDSRLINKYKAGTTEPRDSFGDPTPNAYKLAEALGVSIGDLLPPAEAVAA